MKFSQANAKIQALASVKAIKPYLEKRKVYSFDLLSGWSCPFANDCLSKVVNGKIQDGPNTLFRCFSASQEATFPNVYNLRAGNFNTLRKLDLNQMIEQIERVLPHNLGVCRIHVGGDFFNSKYFESWMNIARNHADKLFYAYTKSIPYWLQFRRQVNKTPNLVLTASFGGRCDALIRRHKLRHSIVIYHPNDTILEIDHDDSHAADPSKRHESFALLIHGTQPKGSEAGEALKVLKKEGVRYAYGK